MKPLRAPPPVSRLAAIVTAYRPNAQFFARFAASLRVCERIIVVDNTPGGHLFDVPVGAPVVILQDGQNKGLGHALNLGLEDARRAGVEAVVLFDQDSSPTETFLRDMLRMLEAARALRDDGPVCIGPRHVDDAFVGDIQTAAASSGALSRLLPVTCLATSGMLFRINAVGADERFTEDFFLDFVDFEWCWRLRRRGWAFYRAVDVTMPHRLGLAQRRFLGLTYHVPAPYRHYFQFRDTLRLTARAHVPFYSKLRLAGILLPKALIYPFLLDRGRERVCWMARGVADAFRRVGGVGAAGKILNH
jgi:rhamnosyltransferase